MCTRKRFWPWSELFLYIFNPFTPNGTYISHPQKQGRAHYRITNVIQWGPDNSGPYVAIFLPKRGRDLSKFQYFIGLPKT